MRAQHPTRVIKSCSVMLQSLISHPSEQVKRRSYFYHFRVYKILLKYPDCSIPIQVSYYSLLSILFKIIRHRNAGTSLNAADFESRIEDFQI